MEGFVALLPASQEGTGALERVTMTSAAGAVGQPGLAVMVVVMEPAGAEGAGEGVDAAAEDAAMEEAAEYWLGEVRWLYWRW